MVTLSYCLVTVYYIREHSGEELYLMVAEKQRKRMRTESLQKTCPQCPNFH